MFDILTRHCAALASAAVWHACCRSRWNLFGQLEHRNPDDIMTPDAGIAQVGLGPCPRRGQATPGEAAAFYCGKYKCRRCLRPPHAPLSRRLVIFHEAQLVKFLIVNAAWDTCHGTFLQDSYMFKHRGGGAARTQLPRSPSTQSTNCTEASDTFFFFSNWSRPTCMELLYYPNTPALPVGSCLHCSCRGAQHVPPEQYLES